jgi:hypothetical protein
MNAFLLLGAFEGRFGNGSGMARRTLAGRSTLMILETAMAWLMELLLVQVP